MHCSQYALQISKNMQLKQPLKSNFLLVCILLLSTWIHETILVICSFHFSVPYLVQALDVNMKNYELSLYIVFSSLFKHSIKSLLHF